MRKTIAIVLTLGLMAIALPAMAEDGNNVPDQIGDIFSGKGNTYLGAELINIPFVLGATGKVWADGMIGKIDDGVPRDYRGGFRAVWDWQTIFK